MKQSLVRKMGLLHGCGSLRLPPLPRLAGLVLPPVLAALALLGLYRFLRWRSRRQVLHKVVLITGASSGIGRCCAHVFYQHGAKVILASRTENSLLKVKDELLAQGQGHEPKIVTIDMNDYDSIRAAAKKVLSMYDHVDILINNAGQSFRGAASETTIQVHEQLMKVNYFGQVVLTQELLPSMINHGGGDVVAVSSIQGKLAVPYRAAYGASKHALECYMDCLRAEHCQENIRVLVVCPGYTKTPLSLKALVGDGSAYGKSDASLEQGMTPEYVAEEILKGVEYDKKHLILGPVHHVLACYWGNWLWNVMAFVMRKRAEKDKLLYGKGKTKAE